MKFLVDESSDARSAAYLNSLGHDATTVARDYASSLADSDVLTIARNEQRVLITNDRDFGELVFRLEQAHSGVIFLRLNTTSLATKIERLNHIINHYSDRLDQFFVVTERTVRVRSTGSS